MVDCCVMKRHSLRKNLHMKAKASCCIWFFLNLTFFATLHFFLSTYIYILFWQFECKMVFIKMLFIMYVVLKLIWPMWILLKIFFIMFLLILLWLLSRKKAMSKASVSTYKYNVVHVLDPSRLGGTIVDFKDSFGMLCLKRNFQSTKTNFQCNFSLTYTWNNECQYNFWPCF